MEKPQVVNKPPNPRKGASIWSIATFAYLLPTLFKGFHSDLKEEDIPEYLDDHSSKKLGDRLESAWQKQLNLKHPSLWRALWAVFGYEFALFGFVNLFHHLILNILQPIALFFLMKYYTQSESTISKNEAYACAGVICGASLFKVLIDHNYILSIQHLGMKLRVSCSSLIYRKSLKLNKTVLQEITIGQMVNLLSNDVHRCDRAMNHVHILWVCPLEIIIVAVLLYNMIGLESTTGILLMISFLPLQIYLAKKISITRLKNAFKTDERVQLMNEIITGIQVIKMYAWEKPFSKLVAQVRRSEVLIIRATYYIKSIMNTIVMCNTKFSVFLTILTYVLLKNEVKAEYVFVVISFYGILKQVMANQFTGGITQLAELNVAIGRIQTFLLYEETDTNSKCEQAISCVNSYTDNNTEVEMRNVSARWPNSTDFALHEINFRAQFNQLIAIIGPVGSGKSSLLQVILKELPLMSGTLKIKGTISYASQEPWVFAGSIQQNILFGQPMDLSRYKEVLKVCALEQDLILFPYGDKTLVGERGVKLSGGQKARLSLARAVYRKADIYLLDDPLSAVDVHVGMELFQNCIAKFLGNKCVILITHQLQYLASANCIYLIKSGKIAIKGTFEKLKQSEEEFAKQFVNSGNPELVNGFIIEKESSKHNLVKTTSNPTEEKEHRSFGAVSEDVYLSYFKAGGNLFTALGILFMFVLTQISISGSDYFLTYWVNLEQVQFEQNSTNSSNTDNSTSAERNTFIYSYSGIVASVIILNVMRTFSFYNYCLKASKKLHDNMFSNVIHTPMRFFNTTSSGRILNRFVKDTGLVDDVLPLGIFTCIDISVHIIGVTILISIIKPWMLIVTIIIFTFFYFLRIFYLRTSRSLKRLEGIAHSPVFGHISTSLQGLTTIRACKVETILEREFDYLQDTHSSAWFTFASCSRAFSFWLDFVCVIYLAIVTFSFFFTQSDEYGGNVGLAITQAMTLTGRFQVVIRQWSELENHMTAVERILEYTRIEKEPERNKIVPHSYWPKAGSITFRAVSLKYFPEDPYVLKRLNFDVKAKEKIGIVGRTGAGKSSIIYGLFQLTETEGRILIDNVEVTKVPFQSLRSKITIIPQDPVLFSGSLRKNLDPFEEFSDMELWNALDDVNLKQMVSELSSGLNIKITEGGSNFSVGQRQLISLARAIVRKNKILVLDEATSNVDTETDAIIQNTIRKKFTDCTVLTIAHRLQTVIDSDKILVMDVGELVEFDHPYLLLKNKDSVFSSLVMQTGDGMARVLFNLAKTSFEEKMARKF